MIANALRLDPTRLTALRRQYVAAIEARFNRLAKAIWQSVVMQDDYGLVNPDITLQDAVSRPIANSGAYKFETDANKVAAYQAWLQQEIDTGLVTSTNAGGQFGAQYLNSAYKAGIIRGWQEANPDKANARVPDTGGTFGQFANESFGLPVRAANVEMVYTRSYTKLKGYTDQMAAATSSAMADALTRGLGAKDTARLLVEQVGLAKSKALRLARTELTYAHAEGQLDSYAEAGIRHVDVLAEWATAGDNRVCLMCSALNGFTITVAQARGLIPRHPNCRCAWKPAINIGKTSKKILGTSQLDAIKKSIEAEGRKGDKSTWAGAEVDPKDIKQLTLVEQQQAAQARRAAALRKDLGLAPTPPKPEPAAVVPPKPQPVVKPAPKPIPPIGKAPKAKAVKLPPAKPVPAAATPGPVAIPSNISYSGKQTEFTQKAWATIGPDGVKTYQQAQAVGKVIVDEILSAPGLQAKMDALVAVDVEVETALKDLAKAKRKRDNDAYFEAYQRMRGATQRRGLLEKDLEPDIGRVQDTLRQVRDFGGAKLNFVKPSADAAKDLQATEDVHKHSKNLPKQWIENIAKQPPIKVKAVARGFYDNATFDLGLSGVGERDTSRTGTHELIHAAEYAMQGMAQLERDFIDSRIRKGKQQVHVKGYGKIEKGYKDDFLEHYMGKAYDSPEYVKKYGGKAYEVLTVGLQNVLSSRTKAEVLTMMARDRGYFKFVLGIAAGY